MKAKLASTRTEITNVYKINYRNGVFCHITESIESGETKLQYRFEKKIGKDKITFHCISNVDELLNTHWSEHYIYMKEIEFNSIEELEHFDDFDRLYYIGSSMDGMICDINGVYKASRIKLDEDFFSIWCKIRGREKSTTLIEKLEKLPQVENCKLVEIPYYNGGGVSVYCELVGIEDELYNSHIKKKYMHDVEKRAMLESLLGEEFEILED